MRTDIKKVILFIVEGVSEQAALEGILNALFKKDKKIRFQVVNTDITSDRESNAENITKKIHQQIKAKCRIEGFFTTDISKVVHLVDMDGAYVSDEHVVGYDGTQAFYTDNEIRAYFVDKMKKRNKRKSSILNVLAELNEIEAIPYRVYYFSCNLDHVLYNRQNAPSEQKIELAEKFADSFYDESDKFVEFMHNVDFMVTGKYEDTWDFIKENTNSLHRHCNFHLFFDEYE